jgi:2-polyprenyl-3-methyl-5-hydroxy-6-metoxy-1,4-benzoquinol methylase
MDSPYILKPAENRTEAEVKYGNHFERNVYLKGEKLDARAALRYAIASAYIEEGMNVLDIGCSNGYGSALLTSKINYTGIDYDANIITLANELFADDNHSFVCCKAQEFPMTKRYDVIIAYEFLEHITDGVAFAQELKKHCNHLFCSVPYNEKPGFWGEHHVIHRLIEKDFPGFSYNYISFEGTLLDAPEYIDGSNLMLLHWSR